MANMAKQKFNVGDMVVAKSDLLRETHKVLGFSYYGDGYSYKVTSKEVDIVKKEIVNGVSFYKEEDLKKEQKP